MVDEKVVSYIRKYKDKYDLEVLKNQLKNQGYSDEDIEEAVKLSSEPAAPTTDPIQQNDNQDKKSNFFNDKILQGKSLKFYLEIAKMPLFIFGSWSIITFVISMIDLLFLLLSIPIMIVTWVLTFGLPAYFTRNYIKKTNEDIMKGLTIGGIIGLGMGLIGLLIGMARLVISPNILEGIFMLIGILPSLIYNTAIGAALGYGGAYLGKDIKKEV